MLCAVCNNKRNLFIGVVFSGDKVILKVEMVEKISIICNMDLFYFPFDRQVRTYFF